MSGEAAARMFCSQRVDGRALDRFDILASELVAENERQNLVSAGSLSAVWERHFADSLQLLDHIAENAGPFLDLGTGAGFPGLILAIARPDTEFVLVESRKRRVEWLVRCIERLELAHCRVIGTKLENVETFAAGVITARAFAPLDRLLRLSARFSTPDTVWLLPKGRSAAQELAQQPADIRQMFHVEQSALDPQAGILLGRGRVRQ